MFNIKHFIREWSIVAGLFGMCENKENRHKLIEMNNSLCELLSGVILYMNLCEQFFM